MEELTLRALEALKKKGFLIHTFETPEEMSDFLVSQVPEGSSCGFGGSMTLKELRVYDRLREMGREVWYHSAPNDLPADEVIRRAAQADVYMLSSNAISADGALLNIDGRGNRVGAVICGPRKVFFAVGENKFCPDKESAMERVKNVACVKNARRLHKNTPCALTGKCADCRSADRICSFTLWTEWVPRGREFHICVCKGELGY